MEKGEARLALARQMQGSVESLPGGRAEVYGDDDLVVGRWPLAVEDADEGLEEVRRGDNAHEVSLLDDENTLCSPFPQQPGCFVHRGLWRTSHQASCHDVPDREVVEHSGLFIESESGHGRGLDASHVPVRAESYERPCLDHRQVADAMPCHQGTGMA